MKKIHMKNGFTMIELVFVIVIIGVLSAVAIPKFLETSKQAHDASVKSFVGTLNRTVGPAMWAKSLAEGHRGLVTYYCSDLARYTEVPKELNDNGNCTFNPIQSAGGTLKVGWYTVSGRNYRGDQVTSPKWRYFTPATNSN